MLSNKTASIVLLVLGIGLLIASVSADITGLGNDPAFGPRQVIGTVVGALIAAVGLYLFKGTQSR